MCRLHGDAFCEKMKLPHDWRILWKPKITSNSAPFSSQKTEDEGIQSRLHFLLLLSAIAGAFPEFPGRLLLDNSLLTLCFIDQSFVWICRAGCTSYTSHSFRFLKITVFYWSIRYHVTLTGCWITNYSKRTEFLLQSWRAVSRFQTLLRSYPTERFSSNTSALPFVRMNRLGWLLNNIIFHFPYFFSAD